jgi:hypothetical protein
MRRFMISLTLALAAFAATAVTLYADSWPSG